MRWKKHPSGGFHTAALDPGRLYGNYVRLTPDGTLTLVLEAARGPVLISTSYEIGADARAALVEALTTEPEEDQP